MPRGAAARRVRVGFLGARSVPGAAPYSQNGVGPGQFGGFSVVEALPVAPCGTQKCCTTVRFMRAPLEVPRQLLARESGPTLLFYQAVRFLFPTVEYTLASDGAAHATANSQQDLRRRVHEALFVRSSREAGLTGRVLYIDLDTVIVGSLEDVAGYTGPFAALSAEGMANERRQTGLNSSVMSWDAGVKGDAGAVRVVYGLLREAYSVVTACVHKLDHWLEMTVPGAAILQEVFPGQIVEYASFEAGAGKDRRTLPPEARVLCFPLEPKPHQVEQAWIKQIWMGHQDERR
ncbi:unnamed protein product [Scytosiphon promiscuus]